MPVPRTAALRPESARLPAADFLSSGETPSIAAARRRAEQAGRVLASLVEAGGTNGGRIPVGPRPEIDLEQLPYPCRRWFWRNSTTGQIMLYRCRRWSCPDCSTYLADRWAKLIAFAPLARHVTLTRLGSTNAEATARLKAITKAVRRGEAVRRRRGRRREPQAFEYFCALEGTPRAGIHAHLLQHGRSLPQRLLSSLAGRYGAGTVAWVRAIDPDDLADQVVEYVVRHLLGVVHDDQPKIGRRIRYSKRFWGDLSRADVTALLWPPSDSPGQWELVKPDVDARAAETARLQQLHAWALDDRAAAAQAARLADVGLTPPPEVA